MTLCCWSSPNVSDTAADDATDDDNDAAADDDDDATEPAVDTMGNVLVPYSSTDLDRLRAVDCTDD